MHICVIFCTISEDLREWVDAADVPYPPGPAPVRAEGSAGLCPFNTCRRRCGDYRHDCDIYDCNCDAYCKAFGDCCPDFHEQCPEEPEVAIDPDFIIRRHTYQMYTSKHWLEPDVNIEIIDQCPLNSSADPTTVELCQFPERSLRGSIDALVPVMADMHLFLNRYCAFCHSISKNLTVVSLSFKCYSSYLMQAKYDAIFDKSTDLFYYPNTSSCVHFINHVDIPNFGKRFLFHRDYVNNCTSSEIFPTNASTLQNCRQYQSALTLTDNNVHLVFKNEFCAYCMGFNLTEKHPIQIKCGSNMCLSFIKQHFDSTWPLVSFSILVDFTTDGSLSMNVKLPPGRCPLGKIYNALISECVEVSCSYGLTKQSGQCQQLYSSLTEGMVLPFPHSMSFVFVTIGSRHDSRSKQTIMFSLKYIISKLFVSATAHMSSGIVSEECQILPLADRRFSQLRNRQLCFILQLNVIQFNLDMIAKISKIKEEIRKGVRDNKLKDNVWHVSVFNFDFFTNTSCRSGYEHICDSPILFDMETPDFQNNSGILVVAYLPSTGFWYRLGNTAIVIHETFKVVKSVNNFFVEIINGGEMTWTASVCVEDYCADTDQENKSCYSYNDTHTHSIPHENIQGWLTLGGNCVSVSVLFITIISVCVVPYLNRLLRILLLNLTIALLIAQATFLAQMLFVKFRTICMIIGILQHYAWLAYFFWMNALAFDIASHFNSIQSLVSHMSSCSSTIPWTRLACFMMYSWISPALIVTAAVLLDRFGQFTVQYGSTTSCWISNPRAVLFFFVIPFSVIILINVLLLGRSMIVIYRVMTDVHLNPTDRNRFCVYIKLMFLMGISWLFGFVAVFTQLQFVWYIFIVLNTLQGVYIFCSFVVNKTLCGSLSTCCKEESARIENASGTFGLSEAGSVVSSIVNIPFPGRQSTSQTM